MIRQYYRFSTFASDSAAASLNEQPKAASVTSQQIKVEFIRIKSYEDDSSTGRVSISGMESLDHLKGAVRIIDSRSFARIISLCVFRCRTY